MYTSQQFNFLLLMLLLHLNVCTRAV